MNGKKFLYLWLIIVLSFLISYIILVYTYDSFNIFAKSYNKNQVYHSNFRNQIPGIINTYFFDSIILGTSLLENSSANNMSKLLGGNFINLSIEGTDLYERGMILKYILKKHQIKKVILSLDKDYMEQRKGNIKYSLENYNYLYDDNIFNDFKLYFNFETAICALHFSKSEKCIGNIIDLDKPNEWGTNIEHSSRFGGIDNWIKNINNTQINYDLKKIINSIDEGMIIHSKTYRSREKEESTEYINKNLISIVKVNSDTEFIILLPPYSLLQYALWKQYDEDLFYIYKHLIEYLVEQSQLYPNLKVYGFDNFDFINKIENYKDLLHYSPEINELITLNISKNIGLINQNNYLDYIQKLELKSNNYDFNILYKKVKKFFK